MKKFTSILLASLMIAGICPIEQCAYAEESTDIQPEVTEVQHESSSNILFEEYFKAEQLNQPIVSDSSCLEGWTLDQANNRTADSTFTVIEDPTQEENFVGKLQRTTSNSDSRQMRMSHIFESAVDGGVVEFELRLNKQNNYVKEFDIDFYDTDNHQMQFRLYLSQSRLQSKSGEFPTTYFFNENTDDPDDHVTGGHYTNNKWLTIKIRMDLDRQLFDFYQNGALLADDYPMIATGNGTIKKLCLSTARNMSTNGAEIHVDDIKLTRISDKLTAQQRVELTMQELSALFESPLETDVELPANGVAGVAIGWATDNEDVITSSGVINRQFMQEQTAGLTATLTCGEYTTTHQFSVTVAAITEIVAPTAELMQKAVEAFKFSIISGNSQYGVKDNLNLIEEYNEGAAALFGGVDITWGISSGVVSSDGTLNKTNKTEKVTLTANLSAKDDNSITGSKTFDIEVLPQGESYVYETFDSPESTVGQTLDGWNEWKLNFPDLTKYRVDSFYTLERESSANKYLQIYRTQVDSDSAYITTTKALNTPHDGGTVNIKFRLKVNSKAIRFLLHLTDSNGVREEIVIDFGNKRINAGQNGIFPITPFGFTPTTDEWHMFEFIADYDRNVFSFYLDDSLIDENLPLKENSGVLKTIGFGTVRNSANKAEATFSIDDIFVTRSGAKIANNTAAEAVAADLAARFDGLTVSEDMELSVKGDYKSTVIWKSSNEDLIKVINGRGIVTCPEAAPAEVTLTVTVVRGNARVLQEVTVTVAQFAGAQTPTQELLDKAADGFTFDEITTERQTMITRDLDLPVTYNKGYAKSIGGLDIAWTSSKPNVITNSGKITRQKYDTFLILTAEFSAKDNPSLKKVREFNVAVIAEGEFILNDGFDEASFENMYKTFEDTGSVVDGGSYRKEVYDGWCLLGSNPGMELFTDTNMVYFPEDPYQTVFNYTRSYNTKSADVPSTPNVTYTYKEFGREFSSGTLYVSQRFYLTNENSRITVMVMNTDGKFSSPSVNCNTTFGGRVDLPSGLVSLNKWHTLSLVVHLSGSPLIPHTFDVFLDGHRLNKDQYPMTNGYPIYAMAISSIRTADGPNSNWYVDDVSVRHVNYDVSEDVASAAEALAFPESGVITGDIDLPTEGIYGTRIIWNSSDKKIVSDGGKVYFDGGPHNVTLTATIVKEDVSLQRTFNVAVAPTGTQKYDILSFAFADGVFKGAQIRNNSFSGNAVLITKLSSRGKLMDVRVSDLLAREGMEQTVTFGRPINAAEYLNYDLEAYVYDTDTNTIISNIYN